eukprot:TRINITY_DN2495_c0_g2_i5.p1 TRINITY_DN2495_c0_g2~~TRINITY_DN2495_c0_g2_i5.p1  ORF type:complete len:179 (-),score=37.16 TRINITY_DN2495_c0_g2_i5:152-688(-)
MFTEYTEFPFKSANPSNDFLCSWDCESKLIVEQPWEDFVLEQGKYSEVVSSDSEYITFESTLQFPQSYTNSNKTGSLKEARNLDLGKGKTIDQKLNFILGSVKRKIRRHIRKPKKAAVRRVPRKRKTQDQINALTRELEEGEEFDKERLKEIAEKTGLNASQVYKWYWEHRRKTSLDM